jgi:hypothetical protein
MKPAVVHVVGAGAAGLSAAHALLGTGRCAVVVHEALPYPGGHRRSFYDETLGFDVDTGNFPLAGFCKSTLSLIDAVGARNEWRQDVKPGVAFVDFATAERWRISPNAGRLAWWPLVSKRRGPGLDISDYWALRRLCSAPPDATVASLAPRTLAMERLWRPLALAALNCGPETASARLLGRVLREAVKAGGAGARVFAPVGAFGRAFVEPIARSLERAGATLRYERRLLALDRETERVRGLEFEHDRIDLGPRDAVVLATPWRVCATIVPGVAPPTGDSAALTVHFAAPPPASTPAVHGAINGPFDWLFAYPDHISVTIKNAGSQIEAPRDALAAECWRGVAAMTGLSDALPPWRVAPSRRAAALATPEETGRRPPCRTEWRNLFLAGGHVGRDLPDGLENAVRSGEIATRAWLGGAG